MNKYQIIIYRNAKVLKNIASSTASFLIIIFIRNRIIRNNKGAMIYPTQFAIQNQT